jgi:hypothetical protein
MLRWYLPAKGGCRGGVVARSISCLGNDSPSHYFMRGRFLRPLHTGAGPIARWRQDGRAGKRILIEGSPSGEMDNAIIWLTPSAC